MANETKITTGNSGWLIAVIFFVLGLAGGYGLVKFGQPSTNFLFPSSPLAAKPTAQGGMEFANKVIKTVSESVDGDIRSISGKQITLGDRGDTLTFTLAEGVRMTRQNLPAAPKTTEATDTAVIAAKPVVPVEISLAELKVGDHASAMLNVTPTGLVAYYINVSVRE